MTWMPWLVKGLEEIIDSYGEQGVSFAFAGMKGPVRDLTERAGWRKKYGKLVDYSSIRQALSDIQPDH